MGNWLTLELVLGTLLATSFTSNGLLALSDIVEAGFHFNLSEIRGGTGKPRSTEELAAEIAEYDGVYERLRLEDFFPADDETSAE